MWSHKWLVFAGRWMEKETSTGGLCSPLCTCRLKSAWSSNAKNTSGHWTRRNNICHLFSSSRSGTMTSSQLMISWASNNFLKELKKLCTRIKILEFGNWTLSGNAPLKPFWRFSGTVELPLNKLPKPVKKSDKCTLQQLPDIEAGRTDVKTVSLFEQKRVRGFWPCFNDESGERELTVSQHLQKTSPCSSTHSLRFEFLAASPRTDGLFFTPSTTKSDDLMESRLHHRVGPFPFLGWPPFLWADPLLGCPSPLAHHYVVRWTYHVMDGRGRSAFTLTKCILVVVSCRAKWRWRSSWCRRKKRRRNLRAKGKMSPTNTLTSMHPSTYLFCQN